MAWLHPDALGRPGEGVHVRVLGVAAFDLALTLAAAWWLAPRVRLSFLATFAVLMLLGLAVHRLVGVRTRLTTAVFGEF